MWIGCFGQPIGSLRKWKDRGVNCLIASETQGGTVKQSDWRAEARRLGLCYYDHPSGDWDADAKDPYLLGFVGDGLTGDEADRRIVLPAINQLKTEKDVVKRQALQKQIDDCVAAHAALSSKCRAIGKPLFCNFSGPDVTGGYGYYKGDGQKPILPYADEIGADWYVKNKDLTRYPNALVGQQLDLLAKWNKEVVQKDKPLWLFVECSNQRLSKTGGAPSPQDMEDQLSEAKKRGAKGVIWFPQQIGGGFSYDNVVSPQLEKLIEISKREGTPWSPPAPKRTIVKVTIHYSDGTTTELT